MLQQKQQLKKQTIQGYKMLTVGNIDMAEVMQQASEDGQVLCLYTTIREASTYVAEVSIYSLSSQSMDPENNTQQVSPKAKSRVQYTERENEISEQQAIHDPEQGQNLEKEDFNVEEAKKQHKRVVRTPFMTRQQYSNKKVRIQLCRVQVWEEDLDLEQESSEHVPELEEDLDMLYDSLENLSDSGP